MTGGPPRAARSGRGRRALGAFTLAIAVVAALELLLRVASCGSERVALTLSPGVPLTLPDTRLGRRPNPAVREHDRVGWRNAERPARATLVAIGDSQTYGAEVTRERAWPQRLAEHAGIDTYNLGLGGYGPVQYLRLMDDALQLEPRVVLIGLYAGNDLADAYAAVHQRGLAPELLPRTPASRALAAVAATKPGDLGDAWVATRTARRGAARQALRDHLTDPIEDHSRLFGLLRAFARALDPPDQRTPTGPRWKPWSHYAQKVEHLDPDLLFPFHDGRSGTILTPAARAAVLDARDPRVAEGVRISLEALGAAARRCTERCRLAVVAIPTKERVFAESVRSAGIDLPRSLAQLVADEQAFWSMLQRVLEGHAIEVIDTLPALRAALARGENPYPPDWNGHPNDVGNDAIALAVSRSASLQREHVP